MASIIQLHVMSSSLFSYINALRIFFSVFNNYELAIFCNISPYVVHHLGDGNVVPMYFYIDELSGLPCLLVSKNMLTKIMVKLQKNNLH